MSCAPVGWREVFKDTQDEGVAHRGWHVSFCTEHFLSTDWDPGSSGALLPLCFFENNVQLWNGWGKNENMKPTQESHTFWKKASLCQSSEMRRGLILL